MLCCLLSLLFHFEMTVITLLSTDNLTFVFKRLFQSGAPERAGDNVCHKLKTPQLPRKLKVVGLDCEICNRPLSRRLDRCDRVIQNESRDPFGGNVYYVTMQITFLTRKFRNGERNLHCDIVHITTKWVFRLTLNCNGVFAIKAYSVRYRRANQRAA